MKLLNPQLLRYFALPNTAARCFHDNSQTPRIVDDHNKKMHKPVDAGYFYRYHRSGIDNKPRIPNYKEPLFRPKYKVREPWKKDQATFGANDYIDLLAPEKDVHPAQLQYHVPRWLRGFPGQHKATEVVKLIHYRNIYKDKMQRNSPHQWHDLCKRIKHLLNQHNYNRADELREERKLGLWKSEPDYYFKDKSRRSYKDLI